MYKSVIMNLINNYHMLIKSFKRHQDNLSTAYAKALFSSFFFKVCV